MTCLKMLINKKYDLIVTDMQLPDSQNFDTLEILYKLYPDTPIVVMSANADSEVVDKIMGIGAKEFFHKDMNYVNLVTEYIVDYIKQNQ